MPAAGSSMTSTSKAGTGAPASGGSRTVWLAILNGAETPPVAIAMTAVAVAVPSDKTNPPSVAAAWSAQAPFPTVKVWASVTSHISIWTQDGQVSNLLWQVVV